MVRKVQTHDNGQLIQSDRKGKEVFYLTTHSTHFYLVIWCQTYGGGPFSCYRHYMGYSFQVTARDHVYAPPSHRQAITHHGIWDTSHGALAGTRNSSMGSDDLLHHEQLLYHAATPHGNIGNIRPPARKLFSTIPQPLLHQLSITG